MIRTLPFLLVAFGAVVLSANENTHPQPKPLDVLSRYTGSWQITFDPDDPFSTGSRTGQWVLGGAYLEESGERKARFVGRDVTTKTLTTYDSDTKQYKRWSFVSNGRALESTGTWEAKTNTMTWVSERFEPLSKRTILSTATETFRDDGTIAVSKVSTDGNREIGRSSEIHTLRQ